MSALFWQTYFHALCSLNQWADDKVHAIACPSERGLARTRLRHLPFQKAIASLQIHTNSYELCHRLVPHLISHISYITPMAQTSWHPRCLFSWNVLDRDLLMPLRCAEWDFKQALFYSWTCECLWPFTINPRTCWFTLCGVSLFLLDTSLFIEIYSLPLWFTIVETIVSSQDRSATKIKGSSSIVVRKEWRGSSPFCCGYTSCPVDSFGRKPWVH